MADFDLSINEAAFRPTGVRPLFDEDRYSDLLDQFVPDVNTLQVSLQPFPTWGTNFGERLARRLELRGMYGSYGDYDEDSRALTIFCCEDIQETNDTLLHETKHLIDDVTGKQIEWDVITKRRLRQCAAAVTVGGVCTGLVFSRVTGGKPEKVMPRTAAASGLLAYHTLREYRSVYAPDEVSAYTFANHPDIVEAYGQIISYVAS